MTTLERFEQKIALGPGCLHWVGAKNKAGYGIFQAHGHTLNAHRVSYELYRGFIPPGFQIDHVCRNKTCVNPEHLEVVTARENSLRGLAPGGPGYNAQKTHCPQGHEYTLENTYLDESHGWKRRSCQACRHERSRQWWKKSKQIDAISVVKG